MLEDARDLTLDGHQLPRVKPCGRVYSPDRDDDPGPGSEHAFRVGFPARGDVLPGINPCPGLIPGHGFTVLYVAC